MREFLTNSLAEKMMKHKGKALTMLYIGGDRGMGKMGEGREAQMVIAYLIIQKWPNEWIKAFFISVKIVVQILYKLYFQHQSQ